MSVEDSNFVLIDVVIGIARILVLGRWVADKVHVMLQFNIITSLFIAPIVTRGMYSQVVCYLKALEKRDMC